MRDRGPRVLPDLDVPTVSVASSLASEATGTAEVDGPANAIMQDKAFDVTLGVDMTDTTLPAAAGRDDFGRVWPRFIGLYRFDMLTISAPLI